MQPPADILNKLADVLNTTVDFLLNGNAQEKAQVALKDAELLKQFKEAEKLPEDKKSLIIKMIRGIFGTIKLNCPIQTNKTQNQEQAGLCVSCLMLIFIIDRLP